MKHRVGASQRRVASRAELAYEAKITKIIRSTVDLLGRPPARGRAHSFSNGVFVTHGIDCWRCDVAIATAAADLARLSPGELRFRRIAVAAFDAMIARHTYADGSFGPAIGGESNNEISDTTAVNFLGTAYLDLAASLSPATRRRWKTSIRRAALWLIPTLSYYVNGNINLDLTLSMYLAYRVTGDHSFFTDYNRSFEFTLHPPQTRWPGYGLHVVRAAHAPDASDGRGYLAEQGSRSPGFDPHYTTVQVATLSTLYLLSRQLRALRLLNLETNMLLTRTNKKTDWFNGSAGSRRPGTSFGYLEVPGPPLLFLADGRWGLRTLVAAQLNVIRQSFRVYATTVNDQAAPIGSFANILLLFSRPG